MDLQLDLISDNRKNVDKFGRFQKGHVPWHKNIKTGLVPRSAFKKGFSPWNKGLTGVQADEKHPSWKGANVSRRNLHLWVVRKLGRPESCTLCKRVTKWIDCANISHEYKRILTDWIFLCRPCHRLYDYGKLCLIQNSQ